MAEHSDSSRGNGDAAGGMVQEIFRMAADGMGPDAIADDLKARRGPGSAHRKWDLASLRKTLSKWPRGV